MTKINKIDKDKVIQHLREISKLSMKANIKHHTVIEKHISISTHSQNEQMFVQFAF